MLEVCTTFPISPRGFKRSSASKKISRTAFGESFSPIDDAIPSVNLFRAVSADPMPLGVYQFKPEPKRFFGFVFL